MADREVPPPMALATVESINIEISARARRIAGPGMTHARRLRIDRFGLRLHANNTKGNCGNVGAHARL
ncbi:hypothetical protein [Burkholderia sp. JP2-270]|uniref:hypothetical protein n=1 Tax=Burkholderia sp. JP2-270 TaxID=2217913 RepID=UPI0013A701E7|nr:hypothetical protein [Burkholderia sp. JP2-270]